MANDSTTMKGAGQQHRLLHRETRETRSERMSLYRELTALGWERQTPVFALNRHTGVRRWRDLTVPDHLDLGGVTRATTLTGERELTVRTAGLGFSLVTGTRLQRDGLDQRLFSLGHAVHNGEVVNDVLLADAWTRTSSEESEAFLEIANRYFADVQWEIQAPAPSLLRFCACGKGFHSAA